MGGVEKGWNGLVAPFLSLVTVFGVLTPWLIVLVPVAVVLIALWRGRKRRHARKVGTQIGKDDASSPSATARSEERRVGQGVTIPRVRGNRVNTRSRLGTGDTRTRQHYKQP